MIARYSRLHREEQDLRRAMGAQPSRMGPALGLAIGCGMTVVGLLGVAAVVAFIRLVLS
jgi:hypothetical protein